MSQSPKQQELFEYLNAPEGVGVFLFPPTFKSKLDNFKALQATANAVTFLHDHLSETKIKARNAKGVSRILDWLANYKAKLMYEADKLRPEINGQTHGQSEWSWRINPVLSKLVMRGRAGMAAPAPARAANRLNWSA